MAGPGALGLNKSSQHAIDLGILSIHITFLSVLQSCIYSSLFHVELRVQTITCFSVLHIIASQPLHKVKSHRVSMQVCICGMR